MRLTNDPKLEKGDLPQQNGVAYNHTYPDGEVTYSSNSHTNELVRLYAKGKMAQLFRKMEGEWYPCTRIIDNTQIFDAMMIAAGYPIPSPLNVIPDNSTCE
jgi:alkaline phosphatase